MLNIKTKDAVAYVTLPRLVPRAKALFFSGFGYVAFLLAQIYAMGRLIPRSHPYLDQRNMGRYGIRHVVAEAADNLIIDRKHFDQVFIFIVSLAGLVLLAAQFIILAYTLIAQPAFAGPIIFFSLFDVGANTATELSYQILDRIFGVPGMYTSFWTGTATNTNATLPWSFHNALHDLFRFYSTALLMIAVLIFAYFVVVVVLETAVSGTPFGQRFQNVWVPIRLVMALGLLVPLNFGLNSAQYLTLTAAKYGAGWATNSWRLFNGAITLHPLFLTADPLMSKPTGWRYTHLTIPQRANLSTLVASMSLVHACAYSYHRINSVDNAAAAGPGGNSPHYIFGDYTDNSRNFEVKPYLVKNVQDWMKVPGTQLAGYPISAWHQEPRQLITSAGAVNYLDAVAFYFGGDIVVRFGKYDDVQYGKEEAAVASLCGDIRIPITTLKSLTDVDTIGGGVYMQKAYYQMVLDMWFDDNKLKQFARSYVTFKSQVADEYKTTMCGGGASAVSGCGTGDGFPDCALPACATTTVDTQFKKERVDFYHARIEREIRRAWALWLRNSPDDGIGAEVLDCGWACAGAWFNKIAEVNGMFVDGVNNIPVMNKYPMIMEQIREQNKKQNNRVLPIDQFEPNVKSPGESAPKLDVPLGVKITTLAMPMNEVYKFWMAENVSMPREDAQKTGNPFVDAIDTMFGDGILNMRGANRHAHPMAQLVGLGKGLMTRAVEFIGYASVSAFFGGVFTSKSGAAKAAGEFAEAVSKTLMAVAFMCMMAGVVLFYILPFLPFLYFFFAVGTWVKTIFEAMVGTPLWALAHLRIDGEGLPGDAAANGYFLLLEIFIRPMLTLFGLIAAVTIFAAQVQVLNLIWDLVLINLSGYLRAGGTDILGMTQPNFTLEYSRGPLDQFFFTIIYAVICYMLGLASFKLIDQIPNNMLRWAGIGVSAFGDMNAEQPTAVLDHVNKGTQTIGSDALELPRTISSAAGSGLGNLVGKIKDGGG